MQLKWIRIENYRSYEDVRIDFCSLNALVGANGAGKSSVLRALDFLFNPAKGKIDEDAFWNGKTERTIRVEALFHKLSDDELSDEKLQPYLRPDGTFHIARSAKIIVGNDEDGVETTDEKIEISQHYCVPMPTQQWLQVSKINGKNIEDWWKDRGQLVVDGISFADFISDSATPPQVGVWKAKAKEFIQAHLAEQHLKDTWNDNPQGYAGVLKGTLPHYVFVPAVKDVTEEAKVTKTNPFGRLLYKILDSVTMEQRTELEGSLKELGNRLNRTGGTERLQSIVETEKRLNEILTDYMQCDLEIEFQSPTMETLLTTPRLFADDGFRNVISNKGHGLQRAIIFSILRCYSEQVTGAGEAKKKTMLFAVEEPELYMHPLAQRTLRRVFQQIAGKDDQVFFSTHSALLVDVACFDEIIRVESLQNEIEGKKLLGSKVWQLPMKKMLVDLKARKPGVTPTDESMRELYSHAYHPNRSEGFFAKKIILVEGPTEQYSIPIYAEACGHTLDSANVSIVDCGGKGQMDRLYRVFNELGIPCYLLFDYDKDNENKDIIKISENLLELLEEDTSVPDDVRIKDKYACFPNKWETSLAQEIEDIEELTQEARKILGISKDSGKPLIARYIAKKITSQSPPIVPKSIKDILEKAVKINWTKSCLKELTLEADL